MLCTPLGLHNLYLPPIIPNSRCEPRPLSSLRASMAASCSTTGDVIPGPLAFCAFASSMVVNRPRGPQGGVGRDTGGKVPQWPRIRAGVHSVGRLLRGSHGIGPMRQMPRGRAQSPGGTGKHPKDGWTISPSFRTPSPSPQEPGEIRVAAPALHASARLLASHPQFAIIKLGFAGPEGDQGNSSCSF